MFLVSRSWLSIIADDYAARLSLSDTSVKEQAIGDALHLLSLAPWHFRFLILSVESMASAWCWVYRVLHRGRSHPEHEMALFEICPIVGAPLTRLYRSFVAVSWFEHPSVLTAYGITETGIKRQERFRQKRREGAV